MMKNLNIIDAFADRLSKISGVNLHPIKLSSTEDKIFSILTSAVKSENLGLTLRVAGGWVRDKLMGKESKDIDIAIDKMTGEQFANIVNQWMKANGFETKSVGIIEANPEQSKHLATATTFIFGLPIDFVNLRTESYADNSRIPTIQVGTAEEDALRRDLTINALFYNINTGQVEDLTGKGLDDLRSGTIRTPLDPLTTFKDDPLRVLRSVRFASRYGFKLDPALADAARNPEIQHALDTKISRERIGAELKGMLKGRNPADAIRMLHDLGLREVVFKKPSEMQHWDMDQQNPHHELLLWDHLIKVVETLDQVLKTKEVSDDERIILILAALLHDAGKLDPSIQGTKELEGKLVKTYYDHEESSKKIAEYLLRELKFSNAEIENVINLIIPAGRAEQIVRDRIKGVEPTRKTLAKFVRLIGEKWKHAVWLAMADEASKRKHGVETEKFEPYENLITSIEGLKVDNAHKIRPILDGVEVQRLLGLSPGPKIGQVLHGLVEWQMDNPQGTKEQATEWVQQNYGALAMQDFPLVKLAAKKLTYNNGYVYLPVTKPPYSIPDGLKNRGEFHITIIEPPEVSKIAKTLKGQGLSSAEVDAQLKTKVGALTVDGEPQMIGLGKQTSGGNETYFAVVKWPEAQLLRDQLGLPSKDLHITLGFKEKDIYGVPKDETTLVDAA
jgi:tRNA nucleotidyltransferase/poly(A) polymerase